MSDLIIRSALIEEIREHGIYGSGYSDAERENDVIDRIESQPTIEAVPVVHGEWVLLDECSNAGVYCSVCHKKVYRKDYANQKVKSKWCPNCGAKMEGGAE